jgi:hypothetical protein
MKDFNLKQYLTEGRLLKEEKQVSKWLIDSFINGVKDNGFNLFANENDEGAWDDLITAAETVLEGTDNEGETPEELINAAQEYAFLNEAEEEEEDDMASFLQY